ncbi:HAD family hydrolase [Conexibacter sp. S30A1]|uniref:HAD family hydrolase n=1 Tax=Conexibacter sp. S30A1 TaxID=2937800 RepID=UPI00200C1D1C|nr:HAD family hydrolase [Conexibacter sp. S30A1]
MTWFQAVLFDNGDTLFHKADRAPATVELASQLGCQLDLERAREAWLEVKAHKHAISDEPLIFGRNRSSDGHRRYYSECYAPLDELVPGLAESFYEQFKTSPVSMIPYPDTAPTLAALREAGISVGIVSNTGWNIREGYERAGLDTYIDTWVLSFEHGIAKPEAEIFAIACAQLAVDPAQTVMVGNNGYADSGAVAAGCTSLVLPKARPGQRRGLDAVLRLVGIEQPSAVGVL